jgi:hypothetical protein
LLAPCWWKAWKINVEKTGEPSPIVSPAAIAPENGRAALHENAPARFCDENVFASGSAVTNRGPEGPDAAPLFGSADAAAIAEKHVEVFASNLSRAFRRDDSGRNKRYLIGYGQPLTVDRRMWRIWDTDHRTPSEKHTDKYERAFHG